MNLPAYISNAKRVIGCLVLLTMGIVDATQSSAQIGTSPKEEFIIGRVVDLRNSTLDKAMVLFGQHWHVKLHLSKALGKQRNKPIYFIADDCRWSDAFNMFLDSQQLKVRNQNSNTYEVYEESKTE